MSPRRAPTTGRSEARELRATVRELAHGGEGVAIVEEGGERRAVFVRGAALKDELDLSVDFTKRPARGRILRVVAPGPARVAPACPYTETCGGCAWMQLSLEGQQEAHRAQLRATLPASWANVPAVIHPPGAALGYRARARLAARASGGRAIVGLREAGTHETVEVDRCIVLQPELDRARLAVAPLLEGAHGHGAAHIALGHGRRPVLELHWQGRLPAATFARLEAGVERGDWAGARVFEGETEHPAAVGDPTPWTLGADGEPLRLAPGGFAQVSDEASVQLGARLLSLAEDRLAPAIGPTVELFAGAGNFTVLLARRAEKVVAVEANAAACGAARQNLESRGLRAKVVCSKAEEYAIARPLSLVVLDPPRTGARLVAERLVLARPRVVAYVSCDLPTLARDLAVLEAAYEPAAIEAFSMFPQTPHLETIAVLERRLAR